MYKRLNILVIDNSVDFTGAIKCALNEAEILREHHRFIFILPRGSSLVKTAEHKGFEVYTLPLRELNRSLSAILTYPFFLLRNVRALQKIVKREKVDVVQINDFYNLLGLGLKISGFRGRILTYVRFLPTTFPSYLSKIWLIAAQKASYKIIAVSKAVLNCLPKHEKNILIYDSVQLDEKHIDIRVHGHVQFLYVGNYIRGKGQDAALVAFAHAHEKNADIRLKFVGSDMGLQKNRDFLNFLTTRAEELGCATYITFEGFCSDVEKAMKQADVILNFSEGESFSMTCLEASFYKRPVVATRCGGPEEIIVDGKTGFLVPVHDIHAMCARMLLLADNSGKRTEMGAAGRDYVTTHFSVEGFKEAFLALLQ